ncbi:hypothetical protein DNTS_029698 [Danionella cerebrum]|uniref:LIM zinc-binding domain-containing protein n=1 Tax=Danionella cerebrum TaxID=2873325 RepID=A0A553RC83_9TELE|nr:hypothetical protein DNTS_029698 [Danionella translucida]
MDELDLLLEQLAESSSHGSDAEPIKQKTLSARATSQLKQSESTALIDGAEKTVDGSYSVLSAPVEAAGVISPSTATQELDSLMNELLGLDLINKEIKVSEDAPTPEPPPKPLSKIVKKNSKESPERVPRAVNGHHPGQGDKQSRGVDAIDDLLGSLSSDMEKMGVRTVAKGHCASCGKCICGKMITALGQVWHPEHFVCWACKGELGTCSFFERDGRPYCETDYQKLFSPLCAYCNGPITLFRFLNVPYFVSAGFLERDGKPYCPRDFYLLFAPKCSGCGEPVKENYLSAANGTWHPDCFVCADCLKPFMDGFFLELNGRPLCSLHYHSRQGSLCGTCGEPVLGRCITAMERKFHPEHFVCAFCLRQLSQGVFKEHGGKPYCSTCHSKLFM